MRIERTNYINSISGKIGDLTLETINKLIVEGKCDAWFSIIQKEIIDTNLDDTEETMIKPLNEAMQNLRKNDYEDNDSQTYHLLTEFVKIVEESDKLETHQAAKIVKSVEAFMAVLS